LGIFRPRQPLDPYIGNTWAKPEGHNLVSEMEKELIKAQDAIRSSVSSQSNPLLCVAVSWAANTGSNGVLVVTPKKLIHIKRDRIEKSLSVRDLAEMNLGQGRNGFVMSLYSEKAVMDFDPQDPGKYAYAIVMTFPTLRVIREVEREIRAVAPALQGEG